MRYLILSDIHANLQALDAVLADAATLGYDEVLVLGDLVGYGGDPAAAMARTLDLAPAAIIRGNHDKVAAGIESAESFNDVARASVDWTRTVLPAAALAQLAALPAGPARVGDQIEICHGAPFDEDYYIFDTNDASRAIDAARARVCLYGHTHIPAVFTLDDDRMTSAPGLADDELRLPREGPALVNVGSVGQPRDGDPRAAYGVIDTDHRTIRLRRIAYDLDAAQSRILDAGLPPWLAFRLGQGQ
ncbi:MAG TPA: metallophosphoesterase family protein [Vicinamibacterales bacterium]|nr:metallophosphoesterase family protein [Vicinamibacterales bacterium]